VSVLYAFLVNLVRYTGGAIVIAGLFVLPFLLVPMMGPVPMTPLVPLILELVIVNVIILGGVALVIHAEKFQPDPDG
jgi:hypothetical protein